MNTALIQTLASGIAVLCASAFLGLWQILSSPDRPNYPTSGPIKRFVMFWFMAALAYRGVEILILVGRPVPTHSTTGQFATSMLLAVLFGIFLVDHVRHWLPARTHRRIQQLLAIARCRPAKGLIEARTSAMENSTGAPCPAADVVGPALAELTLQGMRVAGPMEGPDALN